MSFSISADHPWSPFIPEIAILIIIFILVGVIVTGCFAILCIFRRHKRRKREPLTSPALPTRARAQAGVSVSSEEESLERRRHSSPTTFGRDDSTHQLSLNRCEISTQVEPKRHAGGHLNFGYIGRSNELDPSGPGARPSIECVSERPPSSSATSFEVNTKPNCRNGLFVARTLWRTTNQTLKRTAVHRTGQCASNFLNLFEAVLPLR